MLFSIPVTLRVLQLELSEATFRTTEDVFHLQDLHRHGLGGRLVDRVLGALESSRLLDDDEQKEDDEDVEEDDEADVPCEWFSLADQLLLVPSFFLHGNINLDFFIFLELTGQSKLPSQI